MWPQRRADGMLPLNNCQLYQIREHHYWDFLCGAGGNEPACKCRLGVRDTGLIPGLGRSTGEGNDNPLQYSCLETPVGRGAWQAIVHGVAKRRTQLSDYAQHVVESAPACPCQNTCHDLETESNCWAHLCNSKTILFSWIVSRLIIELRIKGISKRSLIVLNAADCLYLQKGTFCNLGLQTCKDACHQLSNCTLPRAGTSHNTGLCSSSSKQELLFLFLDRAPVFSDLKITAWPSNC